MAKARHLEGSTVASRQHRAQGSFVRAEARIETQHL
jgi:hypothetical protein